MRKKIKTSNFVQSVNDVISIAKKKGVVHLYTENDSIDGRTIIINKKPLLNFGSCSYLGLETNTQMKEASISAIKRFGTQYSSSRTYVSLSLYEELESLLSEIFGASVILSSTTSLGHHAVMPIVIENCDAVIVDHQAHISMQDVLPKLQVKGVTTTIIRHNRLCDLERKILELKAKYERIWYICDGVYSMYGDFCPIREIENLMYKYKQLYLYIDDAHGMSWAGKNGSGYVLSQISLNSRILLATSLAKGFGSSGGVFVFSDQELYWRVKNWGGPLTYSGPQQPAVIGASIASARIHLSNEIYNKQQALILLINYCNEILKQNKLPVITPSPSPIFFIGLGLPKVGYSMVRKLMDDGFYVNLGVFPAVAENCTGIRFTPTLHLNLDDIEQLISRIAFYLPKVLKEEGRTLNDVYRAFRKTIKPQEPLKEYSVSANDFKQDNKLLTNYHTTIKDIPQNLWDHMFGSEGAFDWYNLNLIEESFHKNEKPEDNWLFHYYVITDAKQTPILATFFTELLNKDDMLSHPGISKKIEEYRSHNFYYMTSHILMMGTLLTEGQHLFLDRSNMNWQKAFMLLLDMIWKKQEEGENELILLRDFDETDIELQNFLLDLGFLKIHMPTSHTIEELSVSSMEEYMERLNFKKRYHIRKDALERVERYDVEKILETSDIDYIYQLYENVVNRSFEINTFKFPKKLFENIIRSPKWDVICLKLKPEFDTRPNRLPVAVEFSYKKNNTYHPILVGLDYNFLKNEKVYKQLLYRIVERAIELHCHKINFGHTASLEKRKLGARAKSQVAYLQMKNTFKVSLLDLIIGSK